MATILASGQTFARTTYEFEVQQRKALLAEAEQNVSQLKSGYEFALSAQC
jgi:hypothetical protein